MSELVLADSAKGESFEVPQDTIIVIRLEENPTTGYRWSLDKADDSLLAFQSSEFVLPEDVKIGGGGTHIFRFKAKASGRADVQLKHWREWEGDDSIVARFDVTVVIQGR